jgi:hypothetical protein
MAQAVVVIEILVAQRDPIHSLPDQRLHAVFDPLLVAVVPKTARQPLQYLSTPLYLSQ